jgi:hypothetical protein
MTTLDFRIGDVFEPDDDLSLWFCTIALAFNDIVITHVRADEASEEREQFYFARVGIGHYTEILLYMEREDPKPAIQVFTSSLSRRVRSQYRETLGRRLPRWIPRAPQ